MSRDPSRAFVARLRRAYGWYTIGLVLFVLLLGGFEALGMPRQSIGYVFLALTILMYACIGIVNRTNDPLEYYVAGRRIPAVFNGMATAADWMSAATFIGLAGGLYQQGYAGLAYLMGWTGGFVLVALLLAPYLARFAQFTVPDFLGARYGGHVPRVVGIVLAVACSFTYVVAQIYAVGLIATWLTGVDFAVGILLGLAGVLVCSFLGGMKAITWTQVAQYILMMIAYLTPVAWLAFQQTGMPLPQWVYGGQLRQVSAMEQRLADDPREQQVREILHRRAEVAAHALEHPDRSWRQERGRLENELAEAQASGSAARIQQARAALAQQPRSVAEARQHWQQQVREGQRAEPRRHSEPYPGQDEAHRQLARRNFLALVFCLMLGTAGLPHLLVRYYTTPSVAEARRSVAWALVFIVLLYLTAPALAVLVKHAIYHDVVGLPFSQLPGWVSSWTRVDPQLLSITDINGDGRVQLAEINLAEDVVVLLTPEIAGMPYVISGLVAAGGLAAALSTADALLLTITSALAHDGYYRIIDPRAAASRRVLISKVSLLLAAALASLVAARRPGAILSMVAVAFSMAASGLFPALVCGIFWKRATGLAATLGMVAGFAVSLGYLLISLAEVREAMGWPVLNGAGPWFGIAATSGAVFGVPVGFAVIALVSLVTPRPSAQTQALVDRLRGLESRAD